MFKTKSLASSLLIIMVLFAQVGTVFAAPAAQDTTPVLGTIQSISTETDANGVTTVLVTLLDDLGGTQTVRLSLETAAGLNLVDATTLEVIETQIGQPVTIDPATVIPDEEPTEPDVHLISTLLANFFFDGDPEMASLIDSFHNGDNDAEQVFGFGVIAQALWMSRNLAEDGNADTDLAGLILQAKKSGDYSAFELTDGSSPTNWGQFKKALLDKKNNLGLIVSGQEDPDNSTDPLLTHQEHGSGQDKDKGKGKDKNKNHP